MIPKDLIAYVLKRLRPKYSDQKIEVCGYMIGPLIDGWIDHMDGWPTRDPTPQHSALCVHIHSHRR